MKMKILIACEFSGIVRDAFTKLGHNVMSCDLLPSDTPGKHYQGNVMDILNFGWDMMIAHPPCTYISYAATRFFIAMCEANIPKICVENPVGYQNTVYRKPNQIIHPYYFGDPFQKRTCLWLKGLPLLDYSKTIIPKPEPLYICQGEKSKGKAIGWCEGSRNNGGVPRWKVRSKTFQGIADAMAEQWGK